MASGGEEGVHVGGGFPSQDLTSLSPLKQYIVKKRSEVEAQF